MVRVQNRICKSHKITFISHLCDFFRREWRQISKYRTLFDISFLTLDQERCQEAVKKYFMHLVLYVFLFLCKKNHFCLNKWHKVWHFNEYHYMWCGSKFLLGEIMTQFQIKFPNTNYKNPRILSSIYLTITKKTISDNLSEDCSLNSPKLICVVI